MIYFLLKNIANEFNVLTKIHRQHAKTERAVWKMKEDAVVWMLQFILKSNLLPENAPLPLTSFLGLFVRN